MYYLGIWLNFEIIIIVSQIFFECSFNNVHFELPYICTIWILKYVFIWLASTFLLTYTLTTALSDLILLYCEIVLLFLMQCLNMLRSIRFFIELKWKHFLEFRHWLCKRVVLMVLYRLLRVRTDILMPNSRTQSHLTEFQLYN